MSDLHLDPLDRPNLPSFLIAPKQEKPSTGARLRAAFTGWLPKRAGASPKKITDPKRLLMGPSVTPPPPLG
ncbi:hypothetical protein [Elstera litoralis]|nr:hypothetical protein [Elstera litoralis]